MKKKVFEHNYKSKGEAIEALEKAGYWYRGRKGIFKKYHLYTGVSVYRSLDGFSGYTDRDNIDDFEVKLFEDGYIAVYVPLKSTLGLTSHLPSPVHYSYQAYLEKHQ
ncbi:hypothetical protein [Vibrio parahaemolyticus]|uniref:hypothetical protein n=1 Tax=Vibrio parahaemolyticus TaxID=670 RepID=UPI00215BDB88|nr:hypothetical protein [Vibrio parahaemolyticus]MCR9718231.1 hypothetical protein [Vibrio parahaemolyticus]